MDSRYGEPNTSRAPSRAGLPSPFFYRGRSRLGFRWWISINPAAGGKSHDQDEQPQTEAHPKPSHHINFCNQGPEGGGAEDPTGNPSQANQTIETFGVVRGDAVVEEGEKRGHHEGGKKIPVEIEGPDRNALRPFHCKGVGSVTSQEKSGEDEGKLLPPEPTGQPGKHRNSHKGDYHV